MSTWCIIIIILLFNTVFEASIRNAPNLWPDSSQPLLKLSSSFEGSRYTLIRTLEAWMKYTFEYRCLQKYTSETIFCYSEDVIQNTFCYAAETSNEGLLSDIMLESVGETDRLCRLRKKARHTVYPSSDTLLAMFL